MATSYTETRIIPYSAELLYQIVADVKSYPDFLPWCLGAHMLKETETELVADLVIGYGFLKEKFRSNVSLTPYERIEVQYSQGPFRYLKSYWAFKPQGTSATKVEFFIDFEFKTSLLQKAIEGVFKESTKRLIQAFEKRAQELYQTPFLN
jgi:coenzyme Q-binding protein COQ10